MGIFKKVKKFVGGILKNPFPTIAGLGLSAALGPAGMGLSRLSAGLAGGAASMLLGRRGKKKDDPDTAAVLASPMSALPPVTADAPLRAQDDGQTAIGGAVLGGEGVELLGDTDLEEAKRRRASRELLG